MSIINRFLSAVTEPEFKLARDLTAMAIADGEVTPEEKEAITTICHLEVIDELTFQLWSSKRNTMSSKDTFLIRGL
jgi:hypothetical protein